ncbi:MAG: porin family protein [Bacteroides sp.]
MKKIISTLFVAVACLLMAVPAQAQFQFGIKGGVNLSKVSFSGIGDNFKASNRAGFFIGPMAEFTIPIIGLGVDASALFSQKSTELEKNDTKITNKQNFIEIPVNLKYSVGLGTMASVFIAAGPSFSFNVGGDKWDIKDLGELTTKDTSSEKDTQIGINVGLGAKLLKHLQVGVNYNIPLSKSTKGNFIDQTSKSFSAKTKTWQVSLAYMF